MNVAEARRLVGRRVVVHVDVAGVEPLAGVLRGVPDERTVYLWHDDAEIRLTPVSGVRDAPLTGTCGHEGNRLFGGLCVNCSRREAARRNQSGENATPCADCGGGGAFRNPGERSTVFRCATCHQAAGTLPNRDIQRRAGHRACAGADTHDLRHDWTRMRRSRWQCPCGAKSFEKPAGWKDDDKWW